MTSTSYCAAADHPELGLLSRGATARAATGTPSNLLHRADLRKRLPEQPGFHRLRSQIHVQPYELPPRLGPRHGLTLAAPDVSLEAALAANAADLA